MWFFVCKICREEQISVVDGNKIGEVSPWLLVTDLEMLEDVRVYQ